MIKSYDFFYLSSNKLFNLLGKQFSETFKLILNNVTFYY